MSFCQVFTTTDKQSENDDALHVQSLVFTWTKEKMALNCLESTSSGEADLFV